MGIAYDVSEICGVLRPEASIEIHEYLDERFNEAFLLLGDLTQPLASFTQLWLAKGSSLLGVAGVFRGFAVPIVVIVGSTPDISHQLLGKCRDTLGSPAILVCNAEDPFNERLAGYPSQEDTWLTRATAPLRPSTDPVKFAIPIKSAGQVRELHSRCGISFWTTSMFDFGHYFGVCDSDGTLISSSGLNFVLPSQGYAQIGGLATDHLWRRRGMASASLQSTISSLWQAEISSCGLFADSTNDWLIRFYLSNGFRPVGRFRFYDL